MAIDTDKVKNYLNQVCANVPDLKIDDNLLTEAINGAMTRIASYLDLPALQQSVTLVVTSGNHTFDFNPPADFDRIMVITFIGADDTRGALTEANDRDIEVAIRV